VTHALEPAEVVLLALRQAKLQWDCAAPSDVLEQAILATVRQFSPHDQSYDRTLIVAMASETSVVDAAVCVLNRGVNTSFSRTSARRRAFWAAAEWAAHAADR
jgi:hypothetical protein